MTTSSLVPSSLDEKEIAVLNRVLKIFRKVSTEETYRFALLVILLLPREYKKIRSIYHMSRLICTVFLLNEKANLKRNHEGHKINLHLKLFSSHLTFPFGNKPILGVVISFNSLGQREILEEPHIMSAIKSLFPGCNYVMESFFQYYNPQTKIQTVYLEIEWPEMRRFTLSEIQALNQFLLGELIRRIERLEPKVFMRRNEESIYRDILMLREEIRSTTPIPQVVISFQEQADNILFFTVVLVRMIKKEMPPIEELLKKNYPEIRFIMDKVSRLSKVRRGADAEANVFQVQLPKEKFLRKDYSLNIYKARESIVKILSHIFGKIRDVNGGLIEKQNQKLQEFILQLSHNYDEFLLENFFFSINPINQQALLPTHLLRDWFLMTYHLKEEKLENSIYKIVHRDREEGFLIVIKSSNPSFKEEVKQTFIKSSSLASNHVLSEISIDGISLLGIFIPPSNCPSPHLILKTLENTLNHWSQQLLNSQHLRVCLRSCELSLDPRILNSDQSYNVLKMLYEGLMRLNPSGVPEPAIAQSFEVSPDYKRYLFHLRESQWSNGEPVTAYDFEYSWKTALQFHPFSIFIYNLFIIKNAKKAYEKQISFDAVGVHALDAQTLEIELEYSCPHLPEILCHWSYFLIHSQTDKTSPGWAYRSGNAFVCNGPFKLASWSHNQVFSVTKNPLYWDADRVHLNRIDILLLEDIFSEMHLMQQKKLDIVGRPMSTLPNHAFKELDNDTEAVFYPLSGVYCLWFNCRHPPFNNQKMRKAFEHAIDKKALEKFNLLEFQHPIDTILFNYSDHSTDDRMNRNIPEAQRLFNEGLEELNLSLKDFKSITLNYPAEMDREILFKTIKKQWEEAFPINIILERTEWNVHFNRMLKGNYSIGGMELRYCWKDPLHVLKQFNYSSDIYNITGWEEQAFQKNFEKLKTCIEINQQSLILNQIDLILKEHLPILPLYRLKGNYLKRKWIKNLFTSSFFDIDFKYTLIDRKC